MKFLRDALITVVIGIAAVVLVTYIVFRDGGLSATAEPGRLETSVAERLVSLSIPDGAERLTNPLGDDAWRAAVSHYRDHCATCHGEDGRGKSAIGSNMYPKASDLASADMQEMSDGALFYIIQNGVRWTGMPSWKNEHAEEETWQLVSLIRQLPMLTAEDLQPDPSEQSGEMPARHDHASPEKHQPQPH